MKRINFVTNVAPDSISGGISGMSKAAWDILSSVSNANYVGPVNPRPLLYQHIGYKIRSFFHVPRKFFYFSHERLAVFAKEVAAILPRMPCDLFFFHGFTPWILVTPEVPYIAWNDCTFLQYVSVYHDRSLFNRRDIGRIAQSEANWLRGAKAVWFRNKWAAAGAISEYRLDEAKVRVVGNYGMMPLPDRDIHDNSRDFLFISTDFSRKGGPAAVAAISGVVERFPDTRLVVIGAPPPTAVTRKKFVRYVGFLDKNVPAEHTQLVRWMSTARAILHPTTADMNPNVLIEAGYHGCPAIASRLFAIPDMVQHERSGLLIDNPGSSEEIAAAITRILTDHDFYEQLRQGAWDFTRSSFSKIAFEKRFVRFLSDASA